MSKDLKKTKLFTSINNYEKVNERFAKVKIDILYEGKNRNGSYISKEAIEKASYSLKYVPIVGYYDKDEELFDGHTEKVTWVGDDVEFETLTRPYGVALGDGFWNEVKQLNGETKTYYSCYGYLWIGRYSELESIKDGDYSQSMEIIVNNGYWDYSDNLYHIEEFEFDALCILQKQEPCFEDSTISLGFSKKDYEVEYKTMINELKTFTLESLEEGGSEEVPTDKNKAEDSQEFEDESVENKDIKTDTEEKGEEPIDDGVEGTEEVDKTKEDETKEESEEESKEEEEAKEDFEVKYNETLAELNELKAQYVDLQSSFESLNGEISELREFKSNIEKQAKDEELNSVFAEFEALDKFDEYKTLFEKRYELDKDEIIKSLKVIAFDNNVNIKKTKKDFSKNTTKIPFNGSADFGQVTSEWDILNKYIKR